MNKLYPNSFFLFLATFFLAMSLQAQLGFCSGSSGDPIFTETFGTGTTTGPPLAAGITQFSYTDGAPNVDEYTIANNSNYNDWISIEDHTEGDTNGKFLLANAHFSALDFYTRTITGLCENTTYEFSAWMINLAPENPSCEDYIPVNMIFEVWDENQTLRQASGETGLIEATGTTEWQQYALVFKTAPGQTSVVVKLRNWSNGGCGNDLAIDDIVLTTCGDTVSVANSTNENERVVCGATSPISTSLTATPDNAVFTNHAYQWQQSTDNQNWTDILGETNNTLNTPGVTSTTYFRVKIAEDPTNLSNNSCNVVSNSFNLILLPIPNAPVSNGNITVCEGDMGILQVNVENQFTVNWYDAPTGGNLQIENNARLETSNAGTYYAETVSTAIACTSTTRTPVTLSITPRPNEVDTTLFFCENTSTVLTAELSDGTYLWNTGETTREIEVNQAGVYTVEITNLNGCAAVTTLRLEQTDAPVIDTIKSDGPSIRIQTGNTGEFEYSLDGFTYQDSAVFEAVDAGNYTIYVRDKAGCGTVTQDFFHLIVPKFFTPNGDTVNDLFEFEGVQATNEFEFFIYNRYGQLVKMGSVNDSTWDGTFQGLPMPAGEFWYVAKIDTTTLKGHFSLKR